MDHNTRVLSKLVLLVLILLNCASCLRPSKQNAAGFITRAKARLAKHQYSEAVLELKNAIRLQPKSDEAFSLLGSAYLGAGNLRAGYLSLLHATELNPKRADAQLKLSQMLGAAPDDSRHLIDDAEKRAASVLAVTPDNVDALTDLGFAEFRLGQKDDAARHLQAALDKLPEDLRASMALAAVKLAQNDRSGAEQVLKSQAEAALAKTGAKSARAADAQIALGRFYVALGQVSDAEAAFDHALTIDPTSAPALIDLGTIEMATNRTGDAEKTYQRLAALPDKQFRPAHAVFLFQQGQREAALKEFQHISAEDPKDHAAKIQLIQAYLLTSHLEAAEQELDALLKRNSKDRTALLERSRLYLATGRVPEAQSDLDLVLALEPHLALAHYLKAQADQAQKAPDLRQQELYSTLSADPDFLAARLELAQGLIDQRSAQTALEVLAQAPEAQKHTTEFIVQRNWALFALSESTELRKSINDGLAIRKDPSLLLQDVYLRLGTKDLAGARKSAEALLQLDPQNGRALDALAQTYLRDGNTVAALAVLRTAAQKYPRSAGLQFLLGRWLDELKYPDEARKAYTAALTIDPAFIAAKARLGYMDIASGEPDSASQEFTSVAASATRKAPAEIALAVLAERNGGNIQVAIGHYRTALETEPNNVIALNNLAYLLANDPKKSDEALTLAQHAKELAPENPVVCDTIGWAYYQKGLYRDALREFQEAVAKEPTAKRKYHLAMAFFKAGDAGEARSTMLQARRMDPSLREAAAAERLIGGELRR